MGEVTTGGVEWRRTTDDVGTATRRSHWLGLSQQNWLCYKTEKQAIGFAHGRFVGLIELLQLFEVVQTHFYLSQPFRMNQSATKSLMAYRDPQNGNQSVYISSADQGKIRDVTTPTESQAREQLRSERRQQARVCVRMQPSMYMSSQ